MNDRERLNKKTLGGPFLWRLYKITIIDHTERLYRATLQSHYHYQRPYRETLASDHTSHQYITPRAGEYCDGRAKITLTNTRRENFMVETNLYQLIKGDNIMTTINDQNSERLEIHENVVSSDYIERANDGYYFEHDDKDYKWRLVYFTYATEWTDREHVVYGNTLEETLEHYPKERLSDRLDDDPNDEWTTEDLINNYEWGL